MASAVVHLNEPGRVLPILEEELEDFETETLRFLRGEIGEDTYIPFRLKQGVYGQRQPGVQMIRVKLPFGGVTASQFEALAEVAERYAPLRKGHITTRQNVQFHHVPLPRAPEVLRFLAKAGLTTREACGNTVRNVTGDPWAGVNPDEPFDPTPYAGAFARYFLRNPLTQALPRKFKVAFSSNDRDVAITGMHDLGFIPRMRDGERGFEMYAAGGLSTMPRYAVKVRDFVSVNEYLKVSEAILRIFNRSDELRKNRNKARLKFLVARIGPEAFLEMIEEELKGEWAREKDFRPDRLLFLDDEEATAPPKRPAYAQPNGDLREFTEFVASNVRPQKQQGFSTVEVKVSRGDLTPEQFRGLAAIMREYAGGRARTTIQQNVLLRWVRDESLYEVWCRLKELGLGNPGAHEITDVVSCPGTDSCKLGITSSMGLNRAIEERVTALGITDELTRRIHIKMSGCPNSCGQHHIASIGFHGATIKVGEHEMPAYLVFLGGRYEDGQLRYAKQLKVRLPAKRAPDAVQRFIEFYQAQRLEGERFEEFVDRVGLAPFERLIEDLCIPGEFDEENRALFIDWDRLELYRMQRGEGECAV